MSKEANEEIATNNISSGEVVDPRNRRLGVMGRRFSPKHSNKDNATKSLYKRWKDSIDIT